MVIKEPEVAMINAAVEALNYISKKPHADSDEIMQHIMRVVDARGEVKLAAIAAANRALKLRIKEPGLRDKEIIQQIASNSFNIRADIKVSQM
jgi:hypothetical protein